MKVKTMEKKLKNKTVVLGVTGSIAAYKIANLASSLVKKGANVHVIMTKNATNFINPITFETLTGNKCLVDTFDRNFEFSVEHVSLAKQADIFMVAPASANVTYVCSQKSDKFHLPDCEWAQKINPKNKITYNSRDAAVADGRIPCQVCNP